MAPTDPPGLAPDARPPGRIPVGFLAGFAAFCLLAVIALAIAVHGGPAPAAAGLALAILPVPLGLAGVLYLDRLEPEPPVLLAATFSAGAVVAALIGLLGHALGNSVITTPELGPKAGALTTTLGNSLVGALIAETLKGAILLIVLRYQRAELDGVGDGVVYAAMIGLGFALVSNLFAYVQAENSGLSALISAFFQRGLLTPLWDPLFTAMIGIGVGYAALHPWRRGIWAIAAGWVVAVVLHTAWDDSVRRGAGLEALVYVILLAFLGLLLLAMRIDRRRIVGLINRSLPQFQGPDIMTPDDLQMLGDMQQRRLARQWGRLHCGLSGGQTIANYQLAATELALTCYRADQGFLAGEAFAASQQTRLAAMQLAATTLRDRRPRPPHPSWAPYGRSALSATQPPKPTTRLASRPATRPARNRLDEDPGDD
ncbi:MAG TPA: PrsW family intramembrane metalloprotease [Streptosporangiaceae bacterium]|nr:PrsW family intramembrane metalloprotease [Streptosporangiaceae bacterium]